MPVTVVEHCIVAPVSGSAAARGYCIVAETPELAPARERLLDRAMGADRKRKSSERLRRGRLPSEGLAFAALDETGRIIGTVRLWDVTAGTDRAGSRVRALLLGPLAVDPSAEGMGVGSELMRAAVSAATAAGHGAIILVGDAPYYARFGFLADLTSTLAMPGPVERSRFLALELKPGHLDGAAGVLVASGRRVAAGRAMRLAA
ncbi:putative N-acetyltransferase YhbS [Hoeflea marina]|uniref:Putative N-acetyltransferase YhbS n=1 Tax=Hoeflea marina TaxID=274592 RepID=A0A317PCL3_9HYPH|nr:N-acetyltransferase [Hoeflea marina]PWV97167.1 putative N-acetyltransferase YhbS [Hoeflea marina]